MGGGFGGHRAGIWRASGGPYGDAWSSKVLGLKVDQSTTDIDSIIKQTTDRPANKEDLSITSEVKNENRCILFKEHAKDRTIHCT